MTTRRKDDEPLSRTRFRTDRVLRDNGSWYFLTREGTVEGPFDCEAAATERLEIYVRLAKNGMLAQNLCLSLTA